MSTSRQDRVYPRTAAQLELAYNFGKSFAEIMGVANDARYSAEKTKEFVSEWSKTLETDFSGIRAELSMKIDKDENDNLIGKVHIGANQLTIDTDNFKLSAAGEITATAGYIGGWEIRDGALYSEKFLSTETDYNRVFIAPNCIHLENQKSEFEANKVTLEDGMLKIERTEFNFFGSTPRFAEFTYNGKKYSLRMSQSADDNGKHELYAVEMGE